MKRPTDSWVSGFDSYTFSDRHRTVMKNFNVRYECLDFRDNFHAQKIRNEVQLTIISKESEDSVLTNTNVCSTDPVSKALFEEDDVDMNTHLEYKDPR